MVKIRRIAIIALLIAIVSAMALAPHRHGPGQDEGNASCAVCQASHGLPLAKPALAALPVRELVIYVAPPAVNPLIPRQIDCLAVAPGTSPPASGCV
jgi:hypothetical protein